MKSNFFAVLCIYRLGTLQSNLTNFMQGKKDEAQKTLKTFSKVLRSLTKQDIEASPSDHQLNIPQLWAAFGLQMEPVPVTHSNITKQDNN